MCREGEGPTCACDGETAPQGPPPPTLGCAWGSRAPSPFHAFAPRRLRRGLCDTSCAGLSPAGGCGAQAPFGWLEKGPVHSSAAVLDQKALPNLLPSSLMFWDYRWRAPGVSVLLRGWREVGWRMGGRGFGGPQNLARIWNVGLHAPHLGSRVYVRHAGIGWVSFGDGIWALHPSRLGWGFGDLHITVRIRRWGTACMLLGVGTRNPRLELRNRRWGPSHHPCGQDAGTLVLGLGPFYWGGDLGDICSGTLGHLHWRQDLGSSVQGLQHLRRAQRAANRGQWRQVVSVPSLLIGTVTGGWTQFPCACSSTITLEGSG